MNLQLNESVNCCRCKNKSKSNKKTIQPQVSLEDRYWWMKKRSSFNARQENRSLVSSSSSNLMELQREKPQLFPNIHKLLMKRVTVSVEGNIASGMSSLIEKISGHIPVFTLREPLEKWQNVNNINMLEIMYDQPED